MSYIGNSPLYQSFVTDTFSGNGSTTAFTMSVAPANTPSVLVAVSGVLQDPSTYSVSGTTLTFSAAPPSGTSNISVRYLGIPASGVTTTAYRTVTEFTATASQTTFTPASYTPGFINVYQNGALLGSADYTATNGTTVVLAVGATAGDLIVTESFYVSSVLNAIPATSGSISSTYLANDSVGSAQIAAGAVGSSEIASGAVTQTLLGTNVAGNGPAFSAWQSIAQTIPSNTPTKLTFTTEEFDTNSNYASSTFTPTVAGYYQINACCNVASSPSAVQLRIYKNGSFYKAGGNSSGATLYQNSVSSLVYCNGTTDYIEIYAIFTVGQNTENASGSTWFNGAMVRAA